ncbi:hypothetical protein MNAB215_4370 [Mycobacterium numidiamassiliense]|uniref:Lipoprotein n=1 Tax=Mycobacterium numidiamassiliense TaxID=1841861 RepID=A0A2U3PEH4_9MYCO|nr:hypothetical protein [Mycobacterium numidiamassiliense]SPM42151.1 hypothetical protein MNAB215_4370 [Mycobacterium numidiamassiliense]
MKHGSYVVMAAIGLAAAGCGSSPNSGTTTSTSTTISKTVTASVSQATTTTGANTDLRPLIPVPPNTARTDGPDSIGENGIRLHFLVNGAPMDVMGAYKTALQQKNWSLIVDSSSGGSGGGGATYTATNGNAFGMFNGGGWGGTTDIDACAWPSKPSDTSCGHRR